MTLATRNLTESLRRLLDGSPVLNVGEILVRRCPGGFELLHRDDHAREGLTPYSRVEDARQLAIYDDSGAYRPLKTAPNLRHGWRLALSDVASLRGALDLFYPAALGIFADWQDGTLDVLPLRETLCRQSGMYAITRKITDDQAQSTVGGFCRTDGGCLKTILWKIAPDLPVHSLPPEKFDPTPQSGCLPLLCHEACNLLVAKTREVVKATRTE